MEFATGIVENYYMVTAGSKGERQTNYVRLVTKQTHIKNRAWNASILTASLRFSSWRNQNIAGIHLGKREPEMNNQTETKESKQQISNHA